MKINEIVNEDISRRGFLKGAGIAALFGAVSGCSTAPPQVAKNYRLVPNSEIKFLDDDLWVELKSVTEGHSRRLSYNAVKDSEDFKKLLKNREEYSNKLDVHEKNGNQILANRSRGALSFTNYEIQRMMVGKFTAFGDQWYPFEKDSSKMIRFGGFATSKYNKVRPDYFDKPYVEIVPKEIIINEITKKTNEYIIKRREEEDDLAKRKRDSGLFK